MTLAQLKSKERSTDRILVIRPKQGQRVISSTGLFDPRLFTGGNTLHVVKDPARNLWNFKYTSGGLQEPLKGKYTNFESAYKVAKIYFDKRNAEIVEVID